MALKRKPSKNDNDAQWLTVDASMTGSLTFKDPVNLRINGNFDGRLDTKGNLYIGPKAYVKANIKGEAVVVAGKLEGDIACTGLVELKGSSRVLGNVTCQSMAMETGAILDGVVCMSGEEASIYFSVEELATYLEVDANSVVEWANEGRMPGEMVNDQWRFNRKRIEDWLSQAKIKS